MQSLHTDLQEVEGLQQDYRGPGLLLGLTILVLYIYILQDLPQDIIQKQRKAIQDARKPGKEDAVWISSDSEGELNEVKKQF